MTADHQPRPECAGLRRELEGLTPQLPEACVRAFVESLLARRHEFLAAADRPITPLYLFEPEVLRRRSYRFQAAFNKHFERPSFYYAVKSNNYPEISKILLDTGFGLDVSSGLELDLAVSLSAGNIIFSGPGKTRAELETAVRESDRVVVLVDSFTELANLGQLADDAGRAVRIGVRLTTNPAGLWRKFGILPAMLAQFIDESRRFRNLTFQGIQFHTSWNLDGHAQLAFLSTLGATVKTLPERTRKQIAFLDIGGGYWPERGEWLQLAGTPAGMLKKVMQEHTAGSQEHYLLEALPIEEFADQLGRGIREFILPSLPNIRVCFEPGRWLCNDVMHILMSVVDKKGDDLVITDAGTNAVGWERFETDYFPVLNLSRPALTEKPCHVLGSLCTPHDVWGYNYWGENIEIGDMLMVPNQGAYTYSLRQNFIKPLPDIALVQAASHSS